MIVYTPVFNILIWLYPKKPMLLYPPPLETRCVCSCSITSQTITLRVMFSDIFWAVRLISITNVILVIMRCIGLMSQSAIGKTMQCCPWATENNADNDTDQLGVGVMGHEGGRAGQKGLLRGLHIPLETECTHNTESKMWCNFCGKLKHMLTGRSSFLLLFSPMSPNTWQEASQGREALFGLVFWRKGEGRAVGPVAAGPCDSCLLPSSLQAERGQETGLGSSIPRPVPSDSLHPGTLHLPRQHQQDWGTDQIQEPGEDIPHPAIIELKWTIEEMGDWKNKRIVQDVAENDTNSTHFLLI